jgi:hypothetical protein
MQEKVKKADKKLADGKFWTSINTSEKKNVLIIE